MAGKCLGQKFTSDVASGGMNAGSAMQMLQQVMQMAQQMMQGGGGGGSIPPTDPGAAGCATYYQVTTPSTDPCAIYNPNASLGGSSGSSNVSDSLLDALNGGGSAIPVSSIIKATTSPTQTQTQTPAQNEGAKDTATITPASPGLSGDLRIGSAGATIIANLRQGLSEVAGFFGGSTGGTSQALSAAGRLCESRPWAGSFVANVIPTSFFDGLCEWRGYQVGVIAPQKTSSVTTPSVQETGGTQQGISTQAPASDVPPEVDIWAEPSSARLGTRTYIFWNTKGVLSCKETGPSFSQASLSGGASTVPITDATTFTIECLTPSNETVRDSVTVQIAI